MTLPELTRPFNVVSPELPRHNSRHRDMPHITSRSSFNIRFGVFTAHFLLDDLFRFLSRSMLLMPSSGTRLSGSKLHTRLCVLHRMG